MDSFRRVTSCVAAALFALAWATACKEAPPRTAPSAATAARVTSCAGQPPGTPCGLCMACDGDGGCTQTPADDVSCGTVAWRPLAIAARLSLLAIFGVDRETAWATESSSATDGPRIHRFDGTRWSHVYTHPGGQSNLVALWAADRDNVFAAGTPGVVRWNGTSWALMSGSPANLNGIWGFGSQDLFVVGTGGRIYRYTGSWTQMTSGTTLTLTGVWGTSPTNVYALRLATTFEGSRILHYDGSQWAQSEPVTSANVHLRAIWGSDAENVFAVGDRGTILRLQLGAWVPMESGTQADLRAVFGSGPSDVYAAGRGGTVVRFDGTSWTRMETSFDADANTLWVAAPSDLFVGLADANVHRYGPGPLDCDGLDRPCRNYRDLATNRCAAFGVCKQANTETACTEFENRAAGTPCGTCRVCDEMGACVQASAGTACGLCATCDAAGACALALADDPVCGLSFGLETLPPGPRTRAIWGSGPADVFALGSGGLHYNGTSWSVIENGPTTEITAVWGTGPGNVFAVGPRPFSGNTPIWRFAEGRWTPMDSGVAGDFIGVGGAGQEVFVVGSGGTILRLEGTGWTRMSSGTAKRLNGIWAHSASDVFVVGEDGTILRYDGTSWSAMQSGIRKNLVSVWGSHPADVFAVGEEGTIVHFDGASWTTMESGTQAYLTAVFGFGPHAVYAVGGQRTFQVEAVLLRYDGRRWNRIPVGMPEVPVGLWGTNPLDLRIIALTTIGPTTGRIYRGQPAVLQLDCDGLDSICRDYADVTLSTDRCAALGECKQANTETACTSFTNAAGGTECAPARCVQNVAYPGRNCGFGDAAGICLETVPRECEPFRCVAGRCLDACTGDQECSCTTGRFCPEGVGCYCAGGACRCKKPLGAACSAPNECQSGFCRDGVCCNVACSGVCVACNVRGSVGTCTPWPAGTDPDRDCGTAGACGGACDGEGACAPAADGEPCGTCRVCEGGSCVPAPAGTSCEGVLLCARGETCDGQGTCVGGAPACDDGRSCTVDACDPTTGACTSSPLPNGSPCPDGDRCAGQVCRDGACVTDPALVVQCEDRGPCVRARCEPSTGECRYEVAPAGTSCADADRCNGEETCDGDGGCQAGIPVQVEDGDACTIDACDPATGTVSRTPRDCDGGDACFVYGCDPASGCTATRRTTPECQPDAGVSTDAGMPPDGGAPVADAGAAVPPGGGGCCGGSQVAPGFPVGAASWLGVLVFWIVRRRRRG